MPSAEALVRAYFERMNANDWADAAALFADDFQFVWPQSGEIIPTRAAFVAINANYPAHGRWVFAIRSIVAEGYRVATDVHVTDGQVEATAITFFETTSQAITRITEYWPDSYPAPAWRSAWVARSHGG